MKIQPVQPKLLAALHFIKEGFTGFFELVGFRVAEVPIVFVDRRVGQSKMSRKIFIEAFLWVLRARLDGDIAVRTPASAGLTPSGQPQPGAPR